MSECLYSFDSLGFLRVKTENGKSWRFDWRSSYFGNRNNYVNKCIITNNPRQHKYSKCDRNIVHNLESVPIVYRSGRFYTFNKFDQLSKCLIGDTTLGVGASASISFFLPGVAA